MDKRPYGLRFKILLVFIVVVCVVAALGYLLTQAPSSDGVSVVHAKDLIRQGAVVVDLSSQREYEAGHIEGALNVVYDGCFPCFEEVVATYSKEQCFLLYQHAGHELSQSVCLEMKAVGYTNVSYLIGGYEQWIHKF
ncbi:MAG: rhodanese-like domain-containing protein [Candidatus Thermoplasmatota archaeon]